MIHRCQNGFQGTLFQMNKHWKLHHLPPIRPHPLPPNVQQRHIRLFSGLAQGLVTDGHPLVRTASLTSISAGKRQQINAVVSPPTPLRPTSSFFFFLQEPMFIQIGGMMCLFPSELKHAVYLYNYSLPRDEWYLTSISCKLLPFGCKKLI